MEEHEYYNLHSSAAGAAEGARAAANQYSLNLMVEHLYFVHKMGVREIAHTLRYQEKRVKAVIKRAKENYKAYESRKKHNPEIA